MSAAVNVTPGRAPGPSRARVAACSTSQEHTEEIGVLVVVGRWSVWRGVVVFGGVFSEPVIDCFYEGVGGGEVWGAVPVPVERVGELVESAEQPVGVGAHAISGVGVGCPLGRMSAHWRRMRCAVVGAGEALALRC